MWALLDGLLQQGAGTSSPGDYVLETILALAHHGTLEIRREACTYAKEFLKIPLPYHLRVSVILAQSVVCRLSGEIGESDGWLDGWQSQNLRPATPRDRALEGRITVSKLENMLQRQNWNGDAAVWLWEPGEHPSPLEADTQRRRHQAMTRVFQSMGRFDMARESLEDSLRLANMPANDGHLLVSRLADMHCELGNFEKAESLAAAEIAKLVNLPKESRLLKRLNLALVEARIGREDLASATQQLQAMLTTNLREPFDIVDELLLVRALMAKARTSHLALEYEKAISEWVDVLRTTTQFASFKSGQGFTTAVIYLSLTHALLMIGNSEGAKSYFTLANDILETEKVDYWIPMAATGWFSKISTEIQRQAGMVVHPLRRGPPRVTG
ncbi:hypothetical protein FALBO_14903 [Fusarium albosuccineum]|uniref:MalT-like TPR region domain-containing protein n=1 Tax=Fusarium albosuccineum TaxID=1237068 RepID=A0A8H4KYW7_9HYPO|nr:hypothetical protein FALBO_14903 [Fusarium albosuccineum]